ncbi:TPA: hypothetical protein DCQ44_00950 [Candidatus Taylorbacteria bacterium]|nr:hypothetical protein [Candidatus Taylorbacteria bacterium]
MKKNGGFSLIEIVVVMGILSLLIAGAFFIGFPEYNRYIISSEREGLVDALLEARTRIFVEDQKFVVSTTSNSYCIKDPQDLCISLAHSLPANLILKTITLATSTKMILSFSEGLATEIIIDQNGYIDGR